MKINEYLIDGFIASRNIEYDQLQKMVNNSMKHYEHSQIKHNKKKDDLWIEINIIVIILYKSNNKQLMYI